MRKRQDAKTGLTVQRSIRGGAWWRPFAGPGEDAIAGHDHLMTTSTPRELFNLHLRIPGSDLFWELAVTAPLRVDGS